jgi:hypothetical protein
LYQKGIISVQSPELDHVFFLVLKLVNVANVTHRLRFSKDGEKLALSGFFDQTICFQEVENDNPLDILQRPC